MLRLDHDEADELRAQLDSIRDPTEARRFLFSALGLDEHLRARRVVEVGELPIRCEVYEGAPGSPVVLFLPGLGTYVEMYCELLHQLSATGLTVVGVDPRGHGYSGGPRGFYTMEGVAADLRAVLDRLGRKHRGPVGLFGCSIGANLGLAFAERDERVRAILCHTLFLTECPPDPVHLIGWSSVVASGMVMPYAKVALRSLVDVPRLLRGNALGQFVDKDDLMVWEYPITTLSSVFSHKCRVLDQEHPFRAALLVGDKDEVIGVDYERYLVRRMRHPFDLIVVAGARHMLPFEQAEETVRVASRWLRVALA